MKFGVVAFDAHAEQLGVAVDGSAESSQAAGFESQRTPDGRPSTSAPVAGGR